MPSTVDISHLIAIVADKNSVIDSAALLIASLSEKLKAASAGPDMSLQAAVDAIVADLETHGVALAKAVADNTVAA